MSWPCPDCGEPFVPNHCCPRMLEELKKPEAKGTWRWLARTMMLENDRAQFAFQVQTHRLVELERKVGLRG